MKTSKDTPPPQSKREKVNSKTSVIFKMGRKKKIKNRVLFKNIFLSEGPTVSLIDAKGNY